MILNFSREEKWINKIKSGVRNDTRLYLLVQSRALSLVAGESWEDIAVIPAP